MNYIPNIILLFIFITTLLLCRVSCLAIQQPTVAVEMDEVGMHRKLKYNIQFDNSIVNRNCEYVLSQSLPAAVFISTDELDDLQRLKMLNAIYPKFVDIEIITEKAEPFTVLLRGAPRTEEALTLPIHFRYHAASDKYSAVNVTLSPPDLYLKCPNDDNKFIDTEFPIKSDKLHCLNELKSILEEHNQSMESSEDCNWQQVNVLYQLKAPLQAEIPVGNAKQFTPVLYATIILSWTISIWTVFRTHAVPRRINRELSELQHKVKVN